MTVDELKQRRTALERDMLALIARFEQDTECLVSDVDLVREETLGSRPRTVHVGVEIRVPWL
jgi:hypothetical protein